MAEFAVAPWVPLPLPLTPPQPEQDPIYGQLGGRVPDGLLAQDSEVAGLDHASQSCEPVISFPQVEPRRGGGQLEAEADSQSNRSYFLVEFIIKHKYRQGYQFLTKWQNFPVTEATWEPTRNFVQPDGFINEVFAKYCKAQGLVSAYKQALKLSNRRQTE